MRKIFGEHKQRMTQQELDNKVANILVLGSSFFETREKIVSLNLSLSGADKKLFYNSKILNAFIKANEKEIIEQIVNS